MQSRKIEGIKSPIDLRAYNSLISISPKYTAESLYLSLLFHALDDHPAQFTVENGCMELIWEETSRRDVFCVPMRGNFFTMLNTFLLDLPQLDEPIPESVLEKIEKIDGKKVKEYFGEKKLSEYIDPFEARWELKKLLINPSYQDSGKKLNQLRKFKFSK